MPKPPSMSNSLPRRRNRPRAPLPIRHLRQRQRPPRLTSEVHKPSWWKGPLEMLRELSISRPHRRTNPKLLQPPLRRLSHLRQQQPIHRWRRKSVNEVAQALLPVSSGATLVSEQLLALEGVEGAWPLVRLDPARTVLLKLRRQRLLSRRMRRSQIAPLQVNRPTRAPQQPR